MFDQIDLEHLLIAYFEEGDVEDVPVRYGNGYYLIAFCPDRLC